MVVSAVVDLLPPILESFKDEDKRYDFSEE